MSLLPSDLHLFDDTESLQARVDEANAPSEKSASETPKEQASEEAQKNACSD